MAASIRTFIFAGRCYKNLRPVAFLQISSYRGLHTSIGETSVTVNSSRYKEWTPMRKLFVHNLRSDNFCTSSGRVSFVRTLCSSYVNGKTNSLLQPGIQHSLVSYRCYSDDTENKPQTKVNRVFIGIPNPFKLVRNAMFFFLIRAYFDPECTQDSFKEGAKKALVHVSNEISKGNIDELEGLLTKETVNEVKEKFNKMSVQERQSIAVNDEDILYSFPYQIGVDYDTKGSPWIHILMRFWCHSLTAPSDMPAEIKAIRVGSLPEEEMQKFGTVIRCTYEFKRNFAPEVEPDWTVSFLQHGSVL